DELMDFALAQLITDTGDPRSVIRGHSLARDMYGNDAFNNGYLTVNTSKTGPLFTIKFITPVGGNVGLFDVQTNIPVPNTAPEHDSTFYGYDFTRWIMRFSLLGSSFPSPPDQTLEILIDDYGQLQNPLNLSGPYHVFRVRHADSLT